MRGVRLTIPQEIRGLQKVASVSGGKDSTALCLALKEAEIPHIRVFADTGWEHPDTLAYVDMLEERLGPIARVGVEGGMRAKVLHRAGFPGRLQRWCTEELKVFPLKAFHRSLGVETVNVVGIRAAESKQRARIAAELEDDDEWGGWVWRPLLSWSVQDVLEMHRRHGVPVNPLYQRGHDRVGCYPCVLASKEEIRLVAANSPERIDEIRELERACTAERARRNAERPGRYKHPQATFFQTRHGIGPMGIDEVVVWSRTTRGGRQLQVLQEPPQGGCMRWGLCETGGSERVER